MKTLRISAIAFLVLGTAALPQIALAGQNDPPASPAAQTTTAVGPSASALRAGVARPVSDKPLTVAANAHVGAGQNIALMVAGGAGIVVGAIVGGGAGAAIAVAGAAVAIYGLYEFVK